MKTKDTKLQSKLDSIAKSSAKLRATGWPGRRELRTALGSRVMDAPKGGKQ